MSPGRSGHLSYLSDVCPSPSCPETGPSGGSRDKGCQTCGLSAHLPRDGPPGRRLWPPWCSRHAGRGVGNGTRKAPSQAQRSGCAAWTFAGRGRQGQRQDPCGPQRPRVGASGPAGLALVTKVDPGLCPEGGPGETALASQEDLSSCSVEQPGVGTGLGLSSEQAERTRPLQGRRRGWA